MIPLHHEPWFTFRFADDRLIPRFHLEGIEAGRRVSVFKIDPYTGEPLDVLATDIVGYGGWVELTKPVTVRAGEATLWCPSRHCLRSRTTNYSGSGRSRAVVPAGPRPE